MKTFSKNWDTVFMLKALKLGMQHFITKLACQKSLFRQIEWGVQNGPITKNKVLPLTSLFF